MDYINGNTRKDVDRARKRMLRCGYGRSDPVGWEQAMTINREVDRTMSESMTFCLDVMKSVNFMSLLVNQAAQVAENAGIQTEGILHVSMDMEDLALCPFSELPRHMSVAVLEDENVTQQIVAEIDFTGDEMEVGFFVDSDNDPVYIPDDVQAIFDCIPGEEI